MKHQKKITKAKARQRKPQLTMNRTEQAFYDNYLLPRQKEALLEQIRYERLKVILAPGSTYTPDFFLVDPSGRNIVIEVKGFWREDDRVKIKVAADLFPEWHWLAVTMTTKVIKKIEGFGTDPEEFDWLFQ